LKFLRRKRQGKRHSILLDVRRDAALGNCDNVAMMDKTQASATAAAEQPWAAPI
jgi:hypothetical protein